MSEIMDMEEDASSRLITINIDTFEFNSKLYIPTDIYFIVQFDNEELGRTENTPITEKFIPLDYCYELPIDLHNLQMLDDLINNPLCFVCWKCLGEYESDMYLKDTTQAKAVHFDHDPLYYSDISIFPGHQEISFIDARTLNVSTSSTSNIMPKTKPSKCCNKALTVCYQSSIDTTSSSLNSLTLDNILGRGSVDLLPLFITGEEMIVEITLYPKDCDVDCSQFCNKELSKLHVRLNIDRPVVNVIHNMIEFKVDTMYNLPECYNDYYGYSLVTYLPNASTDKMEPISIDFSKRLTEKTSSSQLFVPKFIACEDIIPPNSYKIDEMVQETINESDIDLKKALKSYKPRITWNSFKRSWLNEDEAHLLESKFRATKLWPLEIYIALNKANEDDDSLNTTSTLQNATKPLYSDISLPRTPGETSSIHEMESESSTDSKMITAHLMSFIDVSDLLYPGNREITVVCPLQTYKAEEMLRRTDLDYSFFIPDDAEINEQESMESAKAFDKSNEKKSRSNRTVTFAKDRLDSIYSRPTSPTPIFDRDGNQTFVLLKIKLHRPFMEVRNLDDITQELKAMLSKRDAIKPILKSKTALATYRKTIRTTIQRLEFLYNKYLYSTETGTFLEYLKRHDIYKYIMETFFESTLKIINVNFLKKPNENEVSDMHIFLMEEMHKVLRKMYNGVSNLDAHISVNCLFFAKEAEERGEPLVAARYYNENMMQDLLSPDQWFNLATFYMRESNFGRAEQCLAEVLKVNYKHKYGLLLSAIVLSYRGKVNNAEKTYELLTLVYPKFIEGWCCFYAFNRKRHCAQRMSVCEMNMEKLSKCWICFDENSHDIKPEALCVEDLSWTEDICDLDNVFYKTAILLLKMRASKFAAYVLNSDVSEQDNEAFKYYLAVSHYLLKDYNKSLQYLRDIRKLKGADNAVKSLMGHCYFGMKEYKKAKKAYLYITLGFNCPEFMHLVFLNLANLFAMESDFLTTKKYLLFLCTHDPTPYDWMLLALQFVKISEFPVAEACFNESNFLDIHLSQTWGFLYLLNIAEMRPIEAEKCFVEFLKWNDDENLKSEIQIAASHMK